MPQTFLRTAFGILAAISAIYIVSHFLRVSNAVIAPDLMRELSLSPGQMGVLTGGFFAAVAVSQIPVGMMLDRLGTRITIPGLFVFTIAGSLLFAVATGMIGLTLSRVLMGLGSGGVLIGALVLCTRWFAPQHLSALANLMVAMGNLGNVLATTPLAATAEAVGWRGAFFVMALLATLAAAVGYLVIRDAPPGHAYHDRTVESLSTVLRGVGEVVLNPRLPVMLAINFVGYGTLLAVLGLWGAPYLHDVHGLDPVPRGNILMVMAVALIVGGIVIAPLDRIFDTRKGVALVGGGASAVVLAVLALLPEPTLRQVTVLFALLAGLNGWSLVALAHGRSIFPDRLVGRGMSMLALSVTGGVAVIQMLSGLIVGAFAGEDGLVTAEGYRWMFAFLAAIVVAGLLVYSRTEDSKPRRAP